MENLKFAMSPSDPLWVDPTYQRRHAIDLTPHHRGSRPPITRYEPPQDEPMQAIALDNAARKLQTLVRYDENVPLSQVQDFFKEWDDADGHTNPNALVWFNDTAALVDACSHNRADLIEFLLGKGLLPKRAAAYFNAQHVGRTKDLSTLELLLDHGWDINRYIGDEYPSVLCMMLNDLTLVEWCLVRGASPNATSPDGTTIMQFAASSAPLAVINTLVARGGQIQGANLVCWAAFGAKSIPDRLELIEYFLDRGSLIDDYVFEREALDGHCRNLLIGWRNGLHFAIANGRKDIVQLLLKRGARSDVETWTMETGSFIMPIEYARLCGHEDIALLLEGGGKEQAGNE